MQKGASYPFYLPHFDLSEKFPPTQLFGSFFLRSLALYLLLIIITEHTDPGSRADPAKPNLLGPGAKTNNISPYLGTEVTGVQISQLNKAGLDELALFAAERKVLVFRDQDFKDLGPDKQIEITR